MEKSLRANGKTAIRGEVTVGIMRDGKVVKQITKKNLIVNAGLSLLANRISDASPSSGCLINYLAVGTGTDVPDATDVALQTENERKLVTSRANDGFIAAISTVFNAGEVPTSTLKEVAAFIDATGVADSGTLFSRANIDLGVTAIDAVFIDWRFTFASA